ncbi:MAG: VOC family protein [Bryobacteraceae bacterium]
MSNPVVQFQILSKSPEQQAEFYAKLFGWTVRSDNPLGYRQIDTGSTKGIQGGIWPAPPQASAFVQLFIEVEDCTAYVEKAAGLGAKVLIPPQKLPQGEEMAVLLDPQGLSFAVMHK